MAKKSTHTFSAHACSGIYDIMCVIDDCKKVLPDGMTPKKLLKTTAQEIFDFGRKVANDDALWAQLPETLVPSTTKQKQIDGSVDMLKDIPMIGGTNSTLTEMATEAKKGTKRDKLRKELKSIVGK